MNIFRKLYCRSFQTVFRLALPLLLYRNPEIRKNIGKVPDILAGACRKRPLIVTDFYASASNVYDIIGYHIFYGIDILAQMLSEARKKNIWTLM